VHCGILAEDLATDIAAPFRKLIFRKGLTRGGYSVCQNTPTNQRFAPFPNRSAFDAIG
jgi:hypothetical protein